MQNETTIQQKIKEYEAQMPPEIMNVIKAFDWKKEVRMIVNQNQLLLDVGADLEESVYLMILGIVEIGEVFERLMEVHELPEDKAQKILTEVERQIFGPMHKKLLDAAPDAQEESKSAKQEQSTKPLDTRDEILQEIEKEPEPIIKKAPPVIDLTHSKELSSSPTQPQTGPIEPFSLSGNSSSVSEVDIDAEMSLNNTPTTFEEPKDPVELNLTNSTVVEADKPRVSAPTKSYTVDPYLEPIE